MSPHTTVNAPTSVIVRLLRIILLFSRCLLFLDPILSKIVVGHRSDRLSRMVPLHLMLAALVRWIAGEQQEMIKYLSEPRTSC